VFWDGDVGDGWENRAQEKINETNMSARTIPQMRLAVSIIFFGTRDFVNVPGEKQQQMP
jgi:hypothetical protein